MHTSILIIGILFAVSGAFAGTQSCYGEFVLYSSQGEQIPWMLVSFISALVSLSGLTMVGWAYSGAQPFVKKYVRLLGLVAFGSVLVWVGAGFMGVLDALRLPGGDLFADLRYEPAGFMFCVLGLSFWGACAINPEHIERVVE